MPRDSERSAAVTESSSSEDSISMTRGTGLCIVGGYCFAGDGTCLFGDLCEVACAAIGSLRGCDIEVLRVQEFTATGFPAEGTMGDGTFLGRDKIS